MLFAQLAHGFKFGRAFFPLAVTARFQVVLIIFQQFLKTGFRYVYQFNLRLGRSAACSATLYDILLARTSRLQHLVVGAVALLQVVLYKIVSQAEDDVRLLIT